MLFENSVKEETVKAQEVKKFHISGVINDDGFLEPYESAIQPLDELFKSNPDAVITLTVALSKKYNKNIVKQALKHMRSLTSVHSSDIIFYQQWGMYDEESNSIGDLSIEQIKDNRGKNIELYLNIIK